MAVAEGLLRTACHWLGLDLRPEPSGASVAPWASGWGGSCHPSRLSHRVSVGGKAHLSPTPRRLLTPFPGPQVNIDHCTKDITLKNLAEPSPSSFDAAQQRVRALMEKDSLPRFVRSPHFRELLGHGLAAP